MDTKQLQIQINNTFKKSRSLKFLTNYLDKLEKNVQYFLRIQEKQKNNIIEYRCQSNKCSFKIQFQKLTKKSSYKMHSYELNHNHSMQDASSYELKCMIRKIESKSDFIYNEYFVGRINHETKQLLFIRPCLILEDLKKTHAFELESLTDNRKFKVQLKKKFDNIIQVLRRHFIKEYPEISCIEDEFQKLRSSLTLQKKQLSLQIKIEDNEDQDTQEVYQCESNHNESTQNTENTINEHDNISNKSDESSSQSSLSSQSSPPQSQSPCINQESSQQYNPETQEQQDNQVLQEEEEYQEQEDEIAMKIEDTESNQFYYCNSANINQQQQLYSSFFDIKKKNEKRYNNNNSDDDNDNENVMNDEKNNYIIRNRISSFDSSCNTEYVSEIIVINHRIIHEDIYQIQQQQQQQSTNQSNHILKQSNQSRFNSFNSQQNNNNYNNNNNGNIKQQEERKENIPFSYLNWFQVTHRF